MCCFLIYVRFLNYFGRLTLPHQELLEVLAATNPHYNLTSRPITTFSAAGKYIINIHIYICR